MREGKEAASNTSKRRKRRGRKRRGKRRGEGRPFWIFFRRKEEYENEFGRKWE